MVVSIRFRHSSRRGANRRHVVWAAGVGVRDLGGPSSEPQTAKRDRTRSVFAGRCSGEEEFGHDVPQASSCRGKAEVSETPHAKLGRVMK